MKRTWVTWILLCALAVVGCPDDRPGDPEDSGTDAKDADGTADLPDAAPDAGDGAVTQYDFCDLAIFEVPRGPDDLWEGLDLWGNRVAHARKLGGVSGPPPQIHVFDLTTCVDRELTQDAYASQLHLWDDHVFWDDWRNRDDPSSSRDIYHFDIASSQEELLSDDPAAEWYPDGNSSFVVYQRDTASGGIQLQLLDLATRNEVMLVPEWASPAYYAISERYVTWTGYTQEPQSVGKDVFYHDLQSGQTTHVDSSYVGYQYGVSAWGDYLVWFGSDIYITEPYHLMLYHIPTGDSTVIVEDDGSVRWGQIHRNLVAYNTSRYLGTMTYTPYDIELYDIKSGVYRRVTAQSGYLWLERLSFPYMLIGDVSGSVTYGSCPRYVANMVLLGLTDEDGNLLLGDGVVSLPL